MDIGVICDANCFATDSNLHPAKIIDYQKLSHTNSVADVNGHTVALTTAKIS